MKRVTASVAPIVALYCSRYAFLHKPCGARFPEDGPLVGELRIPYRFGRAEFYADASLCGAWGLGRALGRALGPGAWAGRLGRALGICFPLPPLMAIFRDMIRPLARTVPRSRDARFLHLSEQYWRVEREPAGSLW